MEQVISLIIVKLVSYNVIFRERNREGKCIAKSRFHITQGIYVFVLDFIQFV